MPVLIKFFDNMSHESMDFERAIYLTGYGKFHFETLFVCAISLLSVGFQCGLSAYILPAAQCELDLTSSQIGLLNVAFLIGGTLSAFLWGILADAKGRRPILIFCHLVNGTITIICATNPSVLSLIICRSINGFLIGGPGSIIFSYLGEFQSNKVRTSVICYSGLFFTSSWLLLPLLAYFILPLDIGFDCGAVKINSWRLFLIILALPELVAGFWLMRLPESPKFFIAKGKPRQALMVLRRMFSGNSGKHPNEFPVKNLLGETTKIETKLVRNVQCRGKTAKMLDKISNQMKNLFRPPLRLLTILTCAVMFANMFGVFGLGLWFPELFARLDRFQELYPNRTATIQDLALLDTEVKNASCAPSFDASVIQTTATMGISSLVANALSGFVAGKLCIKTVPTLTMLMGGLSAASIYFLRSPLQNLIVASIFQASMVTANMTIGSIVVDLFPTSVGAMAICLVMCAGRIGAMSSNIVFGFLMDTHCEVAVFIVAIGVLVGGGLCWMVPTQRIDEESKHYSAEEKRIDIAVTKF